MCFLHPDWSDIIPRGALCLLHGDVCLRDSAGNGPSISLCKYENPNRATTPVIYQARLKRAFWVDQDKVWSNTNVNLKSEIHIRLVQTWLKTDITVQSYAFKYERVSFVCGDLNTDIACFSHLGTLVGCHLRCLGSNTVHHGKSNDAVRLYLISTK